MTLKLYNEDSKKTPVTIDHYCVSVPQNLKNQMVRKLIEAKSNGGRVIVFTNTKK